MDDTDIDFSKYLPLIKSIAKVYARKGIDYDDLIQQGSLGFLEAKKRFDPSKKTSFSTYCTFWVKKYMVMFIGKEFEYTKIVYSEKKKKKELALLQKEIPLDKNGDKLAFDKATKSLKPIERRIIELSYLQKLPLKKIAEIVGLSTERVKQFRQKARRRIKLTENSHSPY